MEEKLAKCIEVTDLKDMLQKQSELYGERPAYKVRIGENKYNNIKDKISV